MAPQLFKNLDIRTRLLLLCLAVAAPLLSMCGLVIWKDYQGLSQVAHRATTFHDELAVRTLHHWLKGHQDELHALSLLDVVQQPQEKVTNQLLAGHESMQPFSNGVALFDTSGKLMACSNGSKVASTLSMQNVGVFQRALKGTSDVSGYTTCPLTNNAAVLVSEPVYKDGKINGVLIESIKPDAVLDLFKGLSEAHGFVICIVDRDNRVIARTLDNEKWRGKDFSHAKTVTAASKVQNGKGTIEVVGTCDPTPRTYAFDRVPNSGWLLILGIPTQAIYGNAHDRLLILVVSTALAVGLSVALAYAFTGNFTGPIHELVREAVSIGRGDYSKRVSAKQGGELGLLARAFNQMALNLELHREHKGMVEKIAESVRQSLDLNQILNTTVYELGQALSASRCCLALVDNDYQAPVVGRHLEFNYVWCDPRHGGTPLKNRSVMIDEGGILKIILEQGAILSLDVMDGNTFMPVFDKIEGDPDDWNSIKSLIACPIILNKQAVGMILVHQCDELRVWAEPELELVEAVARHVALAMEHGSLFARTRRMAEQEFLINQIVRATRTSLDTDTILNTVTNELGRALGVDYCQIAQPRPEGPLVITHEFAANGLDSHLGISLYGSRLDFQPGSDNPHELRQVLGIDLGAVGEKTTRNGLSVREAPIAVIADVDNDRRAAKFMEFLGAVGSRSLIAAPLLQDERVLGILMVHQSTRLRDWQAGEVRLLAALADQLAVAISHAQLFEQVKHQAITDGLTTLYNHIYFKNRLAEELNRAQRKGTCCSLLMIDLDKLKQINDTYGHPVGDAAIRQVATVLKSLLRSGDTAARYGGEEFAVILPETPLSEAVLIADRLRRNINRNPVPGLGHISASIGAAAFPAQSNALEDLIDKADRALYVAKRGGRNRVCVWDEPGPSTIAPDENAGVTPAALDEEPAVNLPS